MKIATILFASAAFASLSMAAPAAAQTAQTITFSGISEGNYTGPTTEGAYTYARQSGGLYGSTYYQDLEGYGSYGGGIASIKSTANDIFTFAGLDFAAVGAAAIGTQTLTVSGYLAGALVSSDAFTANTSSNYAYNYASFSASNLLGKSVDTLLISLPGTSAGNYTYAALDNVRLDVAAVPEPASWGMMILGFGLAGAAMRRRHSVSTRVSYAG